MQLLTKEIIQKLPKLKLTEHKKPENIPIVVKFFSPVSDWVWYATEGEPVYENGELIDCEFFGFVRGIENELGYFCLSELQEATGPLGLKIERDMYFGRHTLAEVMEKRL